VSSDLPDPTSQCDILIVGAGPSGTAAAITAVRQGLKVVIIDKATFPRDKCCGDGLTALALRELEKLGFDPTTVPSWRDIDAAWLRSPSGREVRLPMPNNGKFAAVTPRIELDNALVVQARAEGVHIVENCTYESLSVNTEGVQVTASHDGNAKTITAAWLIAADGMWSPIRKSLGLSESGYLGEWHAFRQYASNVTGVANERLIVWFEEDLLPGYAWSFPLPNNRVNIGFGVLRDGKRRIQDMKEVWTDLLQRPHIVEALGPDFVMEDRHTAWPIPARIDEAVTGSGRVLFVGDAAMATDTLTGEGIGQALLSGSLAAEAIIQGGLPVEVRNTYAQAVKHHLFADHRMSLRLSKILAHGRGARGAIAIVSKSGDWGKRNFARWMFEDEPRAIAFTPKRWHRKMFRLKGPYQS
jgi:geranylgeranyl reductase family protein